MLADDAAVRLYRATADRPNEADVLVRLGDTHQTAGRTSKAREVWREALAALDELGHPLAAQVRDRLAAVPVGA